MPCPYDCKACATFQWHWRECLATGNFGQTPRCNGESRAHTASARRTDFYLTKNCPHLIKEPHECSEFAIGLCKQQARPRPFPMLSSATERYPSHKMSGKDVLKRKSGVIVGDDVLNVWPSQYQNVTSSSTVVAALEAARDAKAPIILQMSQGGAAYFAGKGVANGKQEASIAGGIAGAHYIRAVAPAYGIPVILHTDHCAKKLLPWLDGLLDADEAYFKEHGEPLFSSHMIDLSEEEVDYNIKTTAAYLKRAAPMKQWLEMVHASSHLE
ncbi:hypothetical protein MRB53_041188 [Persea americana]|nr:hypothetical protein MRB53_041188 [Persea americana]